MLKVLIDDEHVQIAFNGNIKTLARDITMLICSIWNEADIPDRDKELFKEYIQNELGKVAFMDEDELEDEIEMLKNKLIDEESLKKELTRLLNKLLEEE